MYLCCAVGEYGAMALFRLLALLSVAVCGCLANHTTVWNESQLLVALKSPTVSNILISTGFAVTWQDTVLVRHVVNITGRPGIVLDLAAAAVPVIMVSGAGVLTLQELIVANLFGAVWANSVDPVRHIYGSSGQIVYSRVVFYNSKAPTALQQSPLWPQHVELGLKEHYNQQGRLSDSAQPVWPVSRAWAVQDWELEGQGASQRVINSAILLDGSRCYTPGAAVAYDSVSLKAALQDKNVDSIRIVRNISLYPAVSSSAEPVIIARAVQLRTCAAAVLAVDNCRGCLRVASGGLLGLGPGLSIANSVTRLNVDQAAAQQHSSTAVYALSLLLSAVQLQGSGAVHIEQLEAMTPAADILAAVLAQLPQRPQFKLVAADKIVVHDWVIKQRQPQQQSHMAAGGYLSGQQLLERNLLQSRRLLVGQQRLQTPCIQSMQHDASVVRQHLLHQTQPGRRSSGISNSSSSRSSNSSSGFSKRRQLHHVTAPDREVDAANSSTMIATADSLWLQQSLNGSYAGFMDTYIPHHCFSDIKGFLAQDIIELVRLLQDPAATHIELVGDIVFDDEHFPPDEANDMTKGINITHKVNIRACQDPRRPIIVDINNKQQQIYVYGRITWSGTIKFINSFPSPRRAGLAPLISVLSVEQDGIISFQDVQMHNSEPGPLFNEHDPFWEQYDRNPAFVPQPGQLVHLDSNSLVILNWQFKKTPWILTSQGTSGVVKAVGSGYWQLTDVLLEWQAPTKHQPFGPSLVLAIVLPVVLGSCTLMALLLSWWCIRRHRKPAIQAAPKVKDDLKDSLPPVMIRQGNNSQGCLTQRLSTAQPNAVPCSMLGSLGLKLEGCSSSTGTKALIEAARRKMQGTPSARRDAEIVLDGLLGEGTFGKVFRGHWQGTPVAVKTMLFPGSMSGEKEKREKMAIMETAISSSLSHPNIVQTYTYVVKPLRGALAIQAAQAAAKRDAEAAVMDQLAVDAAEHSPVLLPEHGQNKDATHDDHGWEVRLVLELCDRGTLKDLLLNGGFSLPDDKRDMAAITATALDVVRAMLHLHTKHIIHSDLKARNVLLKSAGTDVRGFVAKVSDFGLSVQVDPTETHVSNVYQGTLTHMAPELLMYGKISRASDVYAFGILLWEMYTAQQAFKGTPRALLGHEVAKMGRRPEFPPDCPFDYQLLACRCWESDPAIRPTFQQIFTDLQRMAGKISRQSFDSASSAAQQQQGAVSALPTKPSGSLQTAPSPGKEQHVGAIAGAGGDMTGLIDRLDPTKLHNWEPQTSLLDVNISSTSTHTTTPEGSHSNQHLLAGQPDIFQQQQQQLLTSPVKQQQQQNNEECTQSTQHQSDSWGLPSSGGLWFGGEFAPTNVNISSNVQLSVHSDPHPAALAAEAAAAAADKLCQPGDEGAVAAADKGSGHSIQQQSCSGTLYAAAKVHHHHHQQQQPLQDQSILHTQHTQQQQGQDGGPHLSAALGSSRSPVNQQEQRLQQMHDVEWSTIVAHNVPQYVVFGTLPLRSSKNMAPIVEDDAEHLTSR